MRRDQNSLRCLLFKCHYNLLLIGTKWVGIHIKHLCLATLLTELLSINVGFLRSLKLRKVSKDLAYFVSFHLGKDLDDFFQGGYQLSAAHCDSKGRRLQWWPPKASELVSSTSRNCVSHDGSGSASVTPSDVSHLRSVSVPQEEIPDPKKFTGNCLFKCLPYSAFHWCH